MSANILLISDQMIKERTSIHGNIDPQLIYPDLKYAQDAYIKPVLGTALYEKLQLLISNNTIGDPANADYKGLIDVYIADALMYYTLAELPETLSFQFWNKGIVRKQGDNTELPSMAEILSIASRYKSRAEYYANRLRLFILTQNGTNQKFPEYSQPGSTIDTVTPEQRQFTMPIYLGDPDGRDNPWCNPGGFNGQPYKP